jgi:hypothetical protein
MNERFHVISLQMQLGDIKQYTICVIYVIKLSGWYEKCQSGSQNQ